MHKLLGRQLRRYLGPTGTLPESLGPLIAAIDETYHQSDADRALLERTMDTASAELIERHRQLQQAFAKSQEAELELAHQALHDALTGLPNRVLFADRVGHALARSRRAGAGVAVIFIDLDDFKQVNDTFGHSAGDDLLRATAQRLRSLVRGSDTCARLGGDEFAIVLEQIPSEAMVRRVAERALGIFQTSFPVGHADVIIGASLGIAMADPSNDTSDLMRNADMAMYVAKTSGKRRIALYEPAMHTAMVRRLELEQDLRLMVDRGQLTLCYQPIIELETQQVTGVEALARWEHPKRGQISPMEFIPIAEQTGIIVDIGHWSLNAACRACTEWGDSQSQNHDLTVTVNVSGREIREDDYVEYVRLALERTGLPPRRLVLEVTENVLVANDSFILEQVRSLKRLGVRLAIDDFGTGYSSLSYLQQFPIDLIKIDKSFVSRLGNDAEESLLSRAVVSLGEALGIRTVAEGVETLGQFTRLQELGCSYGQGHFFSKALPEMEVPNFLAQHRVRYAALRAG